MSDYSNMKSESQQEKRERLKRESEAKAKDTKEINKEIEITEKIKNEQPWKY